ncbi:MAG: aldehyde dehydrogenase family protein [Verrucomicrobiota bacterium]
MTAYRNFVGGRFVESGRTFENLNPATGAVIGLVHEADRDIVDAAVQAARGAMAGAWGRSFAEARAAMLERIADGIDVRAGEFVAAICPWNLPLLSMSWKVRCFCLGRRRPAGLSLAD